MEKELCELLDMVIDTRLTESQSTAVRLRWFEDKSVTETAAEMGVSPAAVSKTLVKAMDEIRRRLEMTVIYLRGDNSETIIDGEIDRSVSVLGALCRGKTVAERLEALIATTGLGIKGVCVQTGLAPQRLSRILGGHSQPNAEEIVALSRFFDVSTDRLLCGA